MSGSRLAIVPFFGGTSSATHSLEETRLEYLRQTLESLRKLHFDPIVFQARQDVVVVARSVRLNIDPIWLPQAACQWTANLPNLNDLMLVTEADHIWHIADKQVFDIPNDEQYLAPWRLDRVGPKGEQEDERAPTYGLGGKEYGITNGAHHLVGVDDPWGVLPIHGNQSAFSGAFICTADFFKRIKFRKMRHLPVEHATGFDANSTGLCVKTATVDRCWVDHLSPRDRWAKSES